MTTPTGVHYMIGTPSVDVALDLIATGCERIVFSAREPGADWERAENLLIEAGVQVVPHWGT